MNIDRISLFYVFVKIFVYECNNIEVSDTNNLHCFALCQPL